jgi:hypothetical protein
MDDFDKFGTPENLIRFVEECRENGDGRANEPFKRAFVEENRENLRRGFNWWWPRRDEKITWWRMNIG